MEKKNILVPMVLAFLAAVFYLGVLSSRERALSKNYEKVKVLVARTDIPERTILKENMVEPIEMPRKYIAQDAFEYKIPSDLKVVSNLVTKVRIPKGNQITQSSLISLSPEAGLSVKVPPGYRGSTLAVGADLLRLIKPSDRVDILVTFDALMADNRKEKVTATILQNVLVLGVGTDLGQGTGEKGKESPTYTERGVLSLALNPNEAQYLALATKQGETTTVLRGLGDVEMHPMEMASFRKLFR